MINFDDKDLVIICVTLIAFVCAFRLDDPSSIILSIVTGLCGVAVGKNLK